MQNEIWEQVGQFLNRLRCENVTRDTAVEVPGYRENQDEMEVLREKCELMIHQLSKEQRQLLLEWMAKLEDMNSLEGQRAYCQGYVDCILMLSGMGLLRQDLSPEDFMKWIRQ
ncbi:MAG: hypothetical protein K2I10_08610 [Lachnospiraceae bacterium]|nr:hypothetical protein [Lachnospiraceae bacterium]